MAAPTVIDAAWTFDDQNTAQNGRYVIGALFQNSASATASNSLWRDGVIPGVYSAALSKYRSYHVTQSAVPGSSVLVQPGHAIVTRTGQGVYVCPNSTARTVLLDAANATNPRIDLIVLQVQDQPLGDPVTQAQVRAVTGTPSGSPVAPALPTGAILLATVAVAAAPTGNTIVDANITDNRRSAGLAGTIRPLLSGDSVADAGQEGDFRFQSNRFERYFTSVSGWVPFAKVNQGWGHISSATFTVDGGNGSGTTEYVGRSHTFTAEANRRYKVTWRVGIFDPTAQNLNWRIRWAAGGSVSTSDTQIALERDRYDTNGHISGRLMVAQFVGPATAGSVTVGITVQSITSGTTLITGAADNINSVLIEDIGGV